MGGGTEKRVPVINHYQTKVHSLSEYNLGTDFTENTDEFIFFP